MESELLERLERWAKETPAKPMLSFVDDHGATTAALTCAELHRKVQNVAALLVATPQQHARGLGLSAGDRVLLVYPPGLEFIVAFLACLRAGLVAVPVYPPDPRKMKKDITMFVMVAQNSHARVAMTCSSYYYVKKVSAIKEKMTFSAQTPWPDHLQWVVSDDMTEAKGVEPTLWLPPSQSPRVTDLAFLQYTSGSTSTPKGVMLSHGNLNHNLRTITSALVAGRDTVVVSWLPQYHDMGLIGAYLGIIFNGGTGIYLSPFSFIRDPSLWIRLVSQYRGTHLQAPNFAYALCARKANRQQLDAARVDLSCVRHMINGAEPIQGEAIDAFYKAFIPYGLPQGVIKPTFGLAEHTVFVCSNGQQRVWVDKTVLERENVFKPVASKDAAPLTKEMIGCGIPSRKDHGINLRVVDPEACMEQPEGVVGEVWISSPSKACGYYGEEMRELSQKSFSAQLKARGFIDDTTPDPAEFLRTGDLGVIYQNELFICGRVKDLIIIRGRNHYPQDIEASAESFAEIRPGCSAAFSMSDEGASGDAERLVLVAELRDPQIQNVASLCGKIRSAISREHGVKLTLIVLIQPRSIPKTTSGKIARSKTKKALEDDKLQVVYRNEDIIGDGTEEHEYPVEVMAMDRNVEGPSDAGDGPRSTDIKMATVITGEAPERVHAFLVTELAQLLEVEPNVINGNVPLQELGFDSMALTQLQGIVNHRYNVHIPEELLYGETTTLNSLHAALCGETVSSRSTGNAQTGLVDNTRTKHKQQKMCCGCIAW